MNSCMVANVSINNSSKNIFIKYFWIFKFVLRTIDAKHNPQYINRCSSLFQIKLLRFPQFIEPILISMVEITVAITSPVASSNYL